MKIEQPSVIITLETTKEIAEFRRMVELISEYLTSRPEMPLLDRFMEYFDIGDK